MKTRTKIVESWVVIAVLTAGAFFAGNQLRGWPGTAAAPPDTSVQASALLKLTPELSPVMVAAVGERVADDRELVSDILNRLKTHYVEPITATQETAMSHGIVRGMVDSLSDLDSRFLDPEEWKLMDDAAAGRFHGIGAVLALKAEKVGDLDVAKIVVVAPMPGSPALEAGLKAGDSITHVGGQWVIAYDPFREANLKNLEKAVRNREIDELTYLKAFEAAHTQLAEGMSISDALEMLTTKSSGEVALRVDRPGQSKPIELKICRRNTVVDPVTSSTFKKGIVCIRISQFNSRAMKEFSAELDRARASHARALILDLRDNPGGQMDAAADIASRMTGGGVIATIQENHRRHIIRTSKRQTLDIPIVVLVNSGTASVAELVAGTLRDRGNATLVGTTTFGDGLTQTPLLLRDGSAAVLTTGKMLTAGGCDFQGKGLEPDRVVQQHGRRGDAQLEEAKKILLEKLGKA